MSKVEERAAKKALEKFPILFGERMGYDKTNLQQERRNAYEKGYQQAEKDLELGWKDINTIIGLYNDLDDKILCNPERACKEILKQFKERKEK